MPFEQFLTMNIEERNEHMKKISEATGIDSKRLATQIIRMIKYAKDYKSQIWLSEFK